jgi:signal transduction histidine kinase
LLTNGVSGATVTLVGLGVILVVGAIAVSDRLGASMVRPVRRLAGAAVRLSEGDLEQRVEPEGPKEVAAVGQAFNLLADRVGDLLAAERELVADLSHRLRTPLTVLRLEADSVPDPAARARISAVAVELEDAVTALIAEARRPITANVQQPADLAAVTADRVAFWNALAEDQSRPVDSDIASGPIMVGVPAIELEAALDVLLGNVFEHTPDGTRFAVTLQRVDDGDDHGAVVHVDDAGSGFDPERVHRGRSGRDSSGLGLDIARRTVERAGGELRVERSSIGGARISLTFPTIGP